MRIAVLLYGIICYVLFLGIFLYAAGFTANLLVPKGIDSGEPREILPSIVINVLLLSVFAVQHTIMARPAFKAWFTKFIPKPAERSTFVLMTNFALGLTFWQWRPMPENIWDLSGTPALAYAVWGLCAFGWLLVLYSTFLINHFDLFGLRQVYLFFSGTEYTDAPFAEPWLYRVVRNPLMLGFLIAFWANPVMSQGHLVFSLVVTGYVFFGITVEERDLKNALGPDYIAYRNRTPMLIPFLKFGTGNTADTNSTD